MGFWSDVVISVPKVTFRKLEDMVEELHYFDNDEELDSRGRKELAEQLAQKVLAEYVDEYFGESVKAAAQMFRNRSKGRTMLSP
jgi:hypothetical protein